MCTKRYDNRIIQITVAALFVTHACNNIILVGVPLPYTVDNKPLEELEMAKEVQKLGKLPVIFLVNLPTHSFVQVPQVREEAMLPDKCTHNVYDDVICCEAQQPNLNSANIFSQTVKFEDHQFSGYVV